VSAFDAAEIDYLNDQFIGRLATAGPDGKPHVVPVSFSYNPDLDTIDIGGHNFGARKKYRDVQRNPWAAIVVDDLVSTDPWTVRMIEVRGPADALDHGGAALGAGFADELIRIHPDRIVSYGLIADEQATVARSV
jgi:PPOX class F420-dependent enzyme/OxyR family protein